MHTNSTESLSIGGNWRSWRPQLKSMSLHTRSPTIAATVATTKTMVTARGNTYNKNFKQSGQSYKNNNYGGNNKTTKCKFCFGPWEIYNIQKLLDKHASNPNHVNQARMPESTTKFIKNRCGNAAHVDEVKLEVLAVVLDHPIKHVIEEINAYDFPDQEDQLQSCM